MLDSLVVIGLAILSLGTIREADGPVERTFLLRNVGDNAIVLKQGYTSCGCTTIAFDRDVPIPPGDTTTIRLHFNPRGKSGEFYESGTVVYGKRHTTLVLEGRCLSSEESLAQQFPISISDSIRISANRFDLGIMHVGETKERGVVVLHLEPGSSNGAAPSYRQERVTIRFTVNAQTTKGLQHIRKPISIRHSGRKLTIPITLDVLVK